MSESMLSTIKGGDIAEIVFTFGASDGINGSLRITQTHSGFALHEVSENYNSYYGVVDTFEEAVEWVEFLRSGEA